MQPGAFLSLPIGPDPVAPLVLRLAVFLLAAKAGGEIATRLRQPPVLGERSRAHFCQYRDDALGGGRPLVDPSIFSAVVAMVAVTTIVTPPALKWRFDRLG